MIAVWIFCRDVRALYTTNNANRLVRSDDRTGNVKVFHVTISSRSLILNGFALHHRNAELLITRISNSGADAFAKICRWRDLDYRVVLVCDDHELRWELISWKIRVGCERCNDVL